MKKRKKDLELISSGVRGKRTPGDIAVDVIIYIVFGFLHLHAFGPFTICSLTPSAITTWWKTEKLCLRPWVCTLTTISEL